MSYIGTVITDKKMGRGVVTKKSADPENKRFEWLVRFEKGMRWMSSKDIDTIVAGMYVPEDEFEFEDSEVVTV